MTNDQEKLLTRAAEEGPTGLYIGLGSRDAPDAEVLADRGLCRWREELQVNGSYTWTDYYLVATGVGTEDTDPSNVLVRAGYLRGLAARTEDADDREFLLRASRSLKAFAAMLREKG